MHIPKSCSRRKSNWCYDRWDKYNNTSRITFVSVKKQFFALLNSTFNIQKKQVLYINFKNVFGWRSHAHLVRQISADCFSAKFILSYTRSVTTCIKSQFNTFHDKLSRPTQYAFRCVVRSHATKLKFYVSADKFGDGEVENYYVLKVFTTWVIPNQLLTTF